MVYLIDWNNMARVAAIMAEQQKKSIIQTRELSAEEKQRKAAIIAQYGQVSDGEAYPLKCTVIFGEDAYPKYLQT